MGAAIVLGMTVLVLAAASPLRAQEAVERRALMFDGKKDYVDASLAVPLPGDLTLEAWVRTSAEADLQQRIVGLATRGQGSLEICISGGRFLNDNSGGPARGIAGPSGMNDGRWHHVVVKRYEKTTYAVHVDGVYIGESPGTTPTYTTLYIGVAPGQPHFEGLVDEVRLYNRCLTNMEITEIHGGKKPVVRDGLVGWWKLDGDVKDAVGKQDGRIIGAPKWAPGRGKAGEVATEEGVSDVRTIETEKGDVTIIKEDGRRDIVINGNRFKEILAPVETLDDYAALSPNERDRGYILYSRTASDGILPKSRPRPEEITGRLSTYVTPGEKRHVQFTVFALQDLGDVSVSATDLKLGDTGIIPASCLEIRPVRFRFVGRYDVPVYTHIPRLLDHAAAPTTVDRDQNQTFWITLRTPRNAAPGKYRGTITVSAAGGKPAQIKLSANVHPFTLDEGMWWGMYYYWAFPGNQTLERDLMDMRDHGVNAILYCPHPPNNLYPKSGLPPFALDGDKVKVDFTHADKIFALIKKCGFRNPIAYHPRLTSCRLLSLFGKDEGLETTTNWGVGGIEYEAEDYPEELKPVLRDVFRQMVDHSKEAGWGDVYWYLVDEPNRLDGAAYQWAQLEYEQFKQVAPEEKTLCTVYDVPPIWKVLNPDVNVRVCFLDPLMQQPDLLTEAQAEGDKMFTIKWICPNPAYAWARCVAGLEPEKLGLDGMTEWTYYPASDQLSDPYVDFRRPLGNMDVAYAYLSDDGMSLLHTISFEAVQEGIDDGRYIRTLRNLIQRARHSPDPDVNLAGAAAQNSLDEILGSRDRPLDWWSEANLNSARLAVANEIVELRNAVGL